MTDLIALGPRLLLFTAASLALVAFLWLVVTGFQARWTWGVGTLIFPPLGLVHAARHRSGREPLAWVVLAGLVAIGTWLWAYRPSRLLPQLEKIGEWLTLEQTALWVVLAGLSLVALGMFWLITEAFLTHWGWGLGVLALFPLMAPIYLVKHWRSARGPFLLMLLGLAIAATPPIWSRARPIDLGPIDKEVNGERHLTLTGWDRPPYDYVLLRQKPDTVLLQMANRDVTDDTLRFLDGMTQLRELDLNHTRITDAGLAALAQLPALETLRISDTAITDAGFKEHIATLPNLKRLEARETAISADAIQEWRKAKPGRRATR